MRYAHAGLPQIQIDPEDAVTTFGARRPFTFLDVVRSLIALWMWFMLVVSAAFRVIVRRYQLAAEFAKLSFSAPFVSDFVLAGGDVRSSPQKRGPRR